MTATAMLQACDLRVEINGRAVLDGVSLRVEAGQMVGFIGHNGSGKSTLIRLLARHIPLDGGRCMLDGRPYEKWSATEFARSVGFLPQQLPVADGISVRELVRFGRHPWRGLLGALTSKDHVLVDNAMKRADVTAFADCAVDELSGGERQRVWLAMLLAQDTRLLLLDEPISALDLAHQVQVLSLLRTLADQSGLGIVVVLHDINLAAQFCHRLVALRQGRLLVSDVAVNLMRSDILHEIYGVSMSILRHPGADSLLAVVNS